MRKVVVIEHLSLDGVMQAPGRPDEDERDGFAHGGWATARQDPEIVEAMGAFLAGPWSLLLGRRTYEDFAAFWPAQPRPNPFSDALDAVPKLVASRTLREPLGWQGSTLLPGDAADAVARLRAGDDGEGGEATLVVLGSGVLVRSLLARGLVDALHLQVHPVVLGAGRRLFAADGPPAELRLAAARSTPSGVLLATYERP
ncbi:dihydrofolate reductase family protein [Puerhibacterium sp. TATVAM-FAB25]|uniref:dihydrofolate reductase family protein n=1 Tax=Puerhibacterium sp. TATVAM-FAB25 TaxID=3093699 RepID=UPI00397A289F